MPRTGRRRVLLAGVLVLIRAIPLVDENTQVVGFMDRVEVLAVDILQRSRIVDLRSVGAGAAVELSERERSAR